MAFNVVEIFPSIQGEGLDIGVECVFIRFAGCNRKCVWCDTDWSTGTQMSLDEIIKEVEKYELDYVVLTGGEPMLQKELKELTEALTEIGYIVAIETNGTTFVPNLEVDIIAISPKLSSSGKPFTETKSLSHLIRNYDTFLKFVISNEQDMQEVREILIELERQPMIEIPEVVFQPEFNNGDFNELPRLVNKVIPDFKSEIIIRFIPQVHKLLGVR